MAGNLQLCKELALMDLDNLHQLERKEVAHLFLRFDYFYLLKPTSKFNSIKLLNNFQLHNHQVQESMEQQEEEVRVRFP